MATNSRSINSLLERKSFVWVLVGLALIAFIPFLGSADMFDWDEINFAEISREMIVLNDYLRVHVNFEPFWEKPPFFFWLQVIGMKLFGIGEFGARLPNAICGVVTLLVIYRIGTHLFDRRFGALWSLTYLGCIFPHMYFKTGLIDPWFNLFIFGGLYLFIAFAWRREGLAANYYRRSPMFYLMLSGLVVGMGILTKGPVALLVVGLCIAVNFVFQRFRLQASVPQFLLWFVLCFATMLTWYGFETMKNGPWFVQEFIKYQIHLFTEPGAGHAGFPGYHFVVNLFGVFPASIIALPALFYLKPKTEVQRLFRHWMLVFFWVVIILFSIVESKIIHYSSLTYFPLTFLSALTIREVVNGRERWPGFITVLLTIIGLVIGLAVAAVPILGKNIEMVAEQLSDNAAALSLSVPVQWGYWEAFFGLFMIAGLITFLVLKKRGQLIAGYVALVLATGVMTNGLATLFYPKLLWYSQGPMVEFWKTLEGEDVYTATLGFKSYSQYFYTNKQPQENPNNANVEWLLSADIDKPAFFVTQDWHLQRYLDQQPDLEIIGRKGMYVFLKRSMD